MPSKSAGNVGKVIAKAWASPEYHSRLHSEPHAVLAEAGIHVPEGKRVKVLQDTDDTVHVVIPRRPKHISDEQLRSDEVHPDICKVIC